MQKINIRHWYERFQLSETIILWGLAVVVGLTTGVGVWLFKQLINLIHLAEYSWLGKLLSNFGSWTLMLLPILGGIVVGLIIHFFIRGERHHGVAGVMESVALSSGRLRYKRGPVNIIASAISIGSGASVGPEDPSVQIGSYLGSMFGQVLHFSDERMRALVAAGAASGISAAFNAPIAGVFFALEIILGEITGSAFGVVMLASVVSAVFTQIVAGTQPAFQIPPYTYSINWQLPLYLVLGLIAGPVASAYIRLLYLAQDTFARLNVPRWLKPAVAGLILGIVGLFLPQILGVGYDTIGNILNGSLAGVMILLALTAAKLILTPTSIGGGFLGGVFAPSLFIGAALGGAFGHAASLIIPSLGIYPPTFAMVGMAAVLAGAVHGPLTAIILLFEMTNDYHIILPAMFAVIVSLVLSQRLVRDSIYTLGLARRGIRLERGRDVEVLETVTVGEVMQPTPCTLLDTATLAEASEYFMESHHHGAPVVNAKDELVGIFTLQDLDATQASQWLNHTVGEMCTHRLLVAYPDETIGSALRRMGQRDIGRMPVVPRDNPHQLLGLLRRVDLLRAYDAALTRRAAKRHRVDQSRLDAMTPEKVKIVDVFVEPGSVASGKQVKDLRWPPDSIVVSISRRQHVIIPRGDTKILSGDTLTIVTEDPSIDEVKALGETQSAETSTSDQRDGEN
ncbi:MAG: chloride channel protein [Anaerolineales bacterium]